MSVGDDKNYAAKAERRDNTGLLGLKESLEVVTCLKPVNEDGKGSRSDRAAAKAGTECSEKREVRSVSVDSTVTPVEGTAVAEFEKGDEIPIKRNAEVALEEFPETMSVPLAEPCLDKRRKDREAVVAFEKQIGPTPKEYDHQASAALACPFKYGSDSMIEDGGGTVNLREDNCGHPLKMKETTTDHFQHIESSGADGTDKFVLLHRENEAIGGLSNFTFDVCPSNSPSEGKTSKGCQIFVYGSLIQESAPDEACMISAFGPSGGGDIWGPSWRACVERAQSRKSSASNMGTPIESGGKASGQPSKHSVLQSKAFPSPAGRASSKVISSPAVTPIIPLSSPLWNVTTPSCDGLQSSGMPRGGLVDSY